MVKRKLAALEKVDADLANLQNKIKRDPSSYENDFGHQYRQYENQRTIFLQAPASTSENALVSFRDLIEFVAHVSDCYKQQTKEFSAQLIEILSTHHATLEPQLREKIVSSLVLLRKKEVIDSTSLLKCFFPILTSTPSKTLRALLFQKILSDLRSANSKSTNHKLNRTLQSDLHNHVTQDRISSRALWTVKITREMWKRQIWTEAKAVEIMKECALAENEKVVVGGVRFFLGGDKEREELEDESSDEETMDMGRLRHQIGINKKSKKAERRLETAAAKVKRKERKKRQPHPLNFSALHLLHDPQSFAEALFSKHLQNSKSKLNLEQKLLVLQLVSRLIGLHKLTVMSFYSYFFKYLSPRQPSVTSFLASLAQSTHNFVPPDILEPLVQKIANEFVSEAAAGEVAAAGLNAIREICVRQPLAMNDTLLQDLVMYRKSKDKGVMMAAKGLLSLYRQVGAEMLRKRDRGKDATLDLKSGEQKQQRYGEEVIGEIEGLDLLEKWKEEEKERKRLAGEDSQSDEETNWAAWDVQDEDSDDSGGWINVESDDEINISDSDDDKRDAKKLKLRTGPSTSTSDKENETQLPTIPPEPLPPSKPPTSTLATTSILTPADILKLHELRTTSSITALLPNSTSKPPNHQHHHKPPSTTPVTNRHPDEPLLPAHIEGLSALSAGKPTRAQKIALLEQHKQDREEHKSKMARKKERKIEEGKSSTNREKERKKNFLMTLGKARKRERNRKGGSAGLVRRGKGLKMGGKGGGKQGRKG